MQHECGSIAYSFDLLLCCCDTVPGFTLDSRTLTPPLCGERLSGWEHASKADPVDVIGAKQSLLGKYCAWCYSGVGCDVHHLCGSSRTNVVLAPHRGEAAYNS